MTRLFAGTQFDIPPTCVRCDKLESECDCPPEIEKPLRVDPGKQTAKVRKDLRKNKRIVTVVWGLAEPDTDLAELLAKLKAKCGVGGTIKDGELEIQGDHVDRVKATLKDIGFKVRG